MELLRRPLYSQLDSERKHTVEEEYDFMNDFITNWLDGCESFIGKTI